MERKQGGADDALPMEARQRTADPRMHGVPVMGWQLPALRGALLALLAAVLFGCSTPLIQYVGVGIGAFTTSALLYVGAAGAGALSRRSVLREARVRRRDWKRLAAMAFFGAVMGPVMLVWGLQRTSGTSASLMLALEAMFTALLAWRLYGETLDRRVWAALLLLLSGGVLLVLDQRAAGVMQSWGLIAVMIATVAWSIDNSLSRELAECDPSQVVMLKSSLGVLASAVMALLLREPLPPGSTAASLILIGATGYGLSLRCYLLAQRAFGAARTGSVFAFAPFIGAGLAVVLGDRQFGWMMVLASALMLAGVLLHLTEAHSHEHVHESLEHEHAHRHDDAHHGHVHDPMPEGEHSHWHRHEAQTHAHPHVPDVHHRHGH